MNEPFADLLASPGVEEVCVLRGSVGFMAYHGGHLEEMTDVIARKATAFIRRSDLARDRSEQRPERFAVGEKVDAKVTQIEPKTQKISVSIKALEIAEEKEAVAQYGSSDSGASLGDILGAALNKAKKDSKEDE